MIQEVGGQQVKELVYPPFPHELNDVWRWFRELSLTRSFLPSFHGRATPMAITYTEIRNYFELMEAWPDPLQLETIRLLDVHYINSCG